MHKVITGTQLVELLQLGTDLRDHINDQLENIPFSGGMEIQHIPIYMASVRRALSAGGVGACFVEMNNRGNLPQ